MLDSIKKKKKWVQKVLGIVALEKEVRVLKASMAAHGSYVRVRMDELKAYTRVDADTGIRGNNTIILTGIYRKKAFVRFYDVGEGEFAQLINQLRDMKDHCLIRNIDTPPGMHGMFDI